MKKLILLISFLLFSSTAQAMPILYGGSSPSSGFLYRIDHLQESAQILLGRGSSLPMGWHLFQTQYPNQQQLPSSASA